MARIDRVKLRHEIRLKIEQDSRKPGSEVKRATKREAEEVAAWWRDVEAPSPGPAHPYSTGDYRESIHVEQNRDVRGRFLAGFTVITRHPNAGFIEFGTGPDKPGSRSPWGPNTPTPEFAPAGKTAHHFRGTAP